MKKYRVYNIVYDTDGHDIKDLPKELEFEVTGSSGFDPSCDLADLISDETGWCVLSFQFELGKDQVAS